MPGKATKEPAKSAEKKAKKAPKPKKAASEGKEGKGNTKISLRSRSNSRRSRFEKEEPLQQLLFLHLQGLEAGPPGYWNFQKGYDHVSILSICAIFYACFWVVVHYFESSSDRPTLLTLCSMDNFINDIFERIATEAGRLARYNKRHTITSREIQTSVRLVLPGELAKHAVSEGTKAVTKYNSSHASNE